jgi:hypothetical protein
MLTGLNKKLSRILPHPTPLRNGYHLVSSICEERYIRLRIYLTDRLRNTRKALTSSLPSNTSLKQTVAMPITGSYSISF